MALDTIKLYKDKKTLRFDEAGHKFFDDDTGERVVSVTGISGVLDKPALIFWAVNKCIDFLQENWKADTIYSQGEIFSILEQAKKQHQKFKRESADIGTQIHQWISSWIKGESPAMPDDEQVLNGVNAFLDWRSEGNIEFIASERPVFSQKHKFAGILDAEAIIEGKRFIVDFKSSNGIYENMKLQVAGYRLAREEETGKKYDGSLIIRFGKDDGEFEVCELPDYQSDKKAFLNALALKRWKS